MATTCTVKEITSMEPSIHPHHTHIQLATYTMSSLDVVCPHGGGKPIPEIIQPLVKYL